MLIALGFHSIFISSESMFGARFGGNVKLWLVRLTVSRLDTCAFDNVSVSEKCLEFMQQTCT